MSLTARDTRVRRLRQRIFTASQAGLCTAREPPRSTSSTRSPKL
jgi:hypothetical protein